MSQNISCESFMFDTTGKFGIQICPPVVIITLHFSQNIKMENVGEVVMLFCKWHASVQAM